MHQSRSQLLQVAKNNLGSSVTVRHGVVSGLRVLEADGSSPFRDCRLNKARSFAGGSVRCLCFLGMPIKKSGPDGSVCKYHLVDWTPGARGDLLCGGFVSQQ